MSTARSSVKQYKKFIRHISLEINYFGRKDHPCVCKVRLYVFKKDFRFEGIDLNELLVGVGDGLWSSEIFFYC